MGSTTLSTAHAQTVVTSATPVTTCGPVLVNEQTLLAPARVEARTIPAQYEWAVRDELVTPEQVTRHNEPAVYDEVVETKVLTPAKVIRRAVPPSVRTVNQTVMVGPPLVATAYSTPYMATSWPVANAGYYVIPNAVSYVAPQYATVQMQVVDNPGYVVEDVIPAKIKTQVRKVLVQPARTVETVQPASFRKVSYLRELSPARTESVQISAVYETRQAARTSCAQAVASVGTIGPMIGSAIVSSASTPVVVSGPVMETATIVNPTSVVVAQGGYVSTAFSGMGVTQPVTIASSPVIFSR